jgi:hypothetical protein
VIDTRDAASAAAIERAGHHVCVTDTMMTSPGRAAVVARSALELLAAAGAA